MSVAFIANVGLRDIEINRAALPKKARPLAELIMEDNWADWQDWQKDISLPVISKALKSILLKETDLSKIILFATNSRDALQSEEDTAPLAQIVQRYLSRTVPQISAKMIEIIEITGNANDYDRMMAFYKSRLNRLKDARYERIYLEVTGGTSAMSFVLLWQSVEVYPGQVRPLFIAEDSEIPYSLSIGSRLQFEAVLDDFQDMIEIHQYHAALNVIEAHEDLCSRMWVYDEAIKALTIYARQRFNFNFEDAERTLFGVDEHLHDTLRDRLNLLANEITSRDFTWLLREEYYSLEIDLENAAYRTALTGIYAFIEAAMRTYLIHEQVIIPQTNELNRRWLQENSILYRKVSQRYSHLRPGYKLMRQDFISILRVLKEDNRHIETILKYVDKLSSFQRLRNASVHNHAGVSKQQLEASYEDGIDGLCRDLKALYKEVTGMQIKNNAFDAINKLILDLSKVSM